MKRSTPAVLTAALTALALAVSGCGLGSTATPAAQTASAGAIPELRPDQKVSIVFESYNFGQAGAWTDTFNELIGKFQQKFPNITVKAQKPQGNSPNPATDTISSLQSQIVAGSTPDVVQLGFSDLDFTVNQLGAKPLDDLVGTSAVQANFDGAKYPFAKSARTLGDWKGKTYGVPFVFSTPVLYYNASLFQQAGLDPANPPKTWADVQQAAQAIKTKTSKDGVYVDCLTKAAKDWCFQALVRSKGGRVVSEDRSKLTYADQASVDTVTDFQKMVTAGVTPKVTQTQSVDLFSRGELGMLLESSSVQGTFIKASTGKWDLKAAPMPGFADRTAIPTNSGAALFVFSNDAAKQRAGWELIKFLTSEEAYVTISSKIGYLPLRTGLINDPDGLQGWNAKNPLMKPNLDQLEHLEPWVSFPGKDYLQIRDGMMEAVEKVVYQGADPASTLKAAQDRGAKLLPAGSGS